MIGKETLQNLLNQYNFDSSSKELFIYEKDDIIGICYNLLHHLYGPLNRVYIPQTIDETKDFLTKFIAFKKQKNNEFLFSLPTYDTLYANPTFYPNPILLKEQEEKNKYTPKQLRTASLLLDILLEKLKLQKLTYQNLCQLLEKQYKTENLFHEKLALYTKQKVVKKIKNKIPEDKFEPNNIILPLKKQLQSITTENQMISFIYSLINYIKNVEQDEKLINNKYQLIVTPLKISLLEEQINYIDNLLNHIKKIFSKKPELELELQKISSNNSLNKVVNYQTFVANEKKRINEKYEMISEIDILTIADFLIEFDNLNIKEPSLPTNTSDKYYTFEMTMQYLEQEFADRPLKEQRMIYILSSFIQNQLHYSSSSSEQLTEIKKVLDIINNSENIIPKIKIFNALDTTNPSTFLENLKTLYQELLTTKSSTLKNDIHLFFKEVPPLCLNPYLVATSKKSLISDTNKNKSFTYIINFQKNTHFYFTPHELVLDTSNMQLRLANKHPLFIIDPENNQIKNEKSAIIKVSRFTVMKDNSNNPIITQTNADYYQEITIARKEDINE